MTKNKLNFIVAGAGSGKTTYLINELSGKIRSGDLSPEQVLISTFTKAAASEIMERALKKLAEDGGNPDAVMALRAAEISTIHGLGLSFIRRYWYHFGISPEPEVLDEDSGSRFIRKMLKTLEIPEETEKRLNELGRIFSFTGEGFSYDPLGWQKQLEELLNLAIQNGVKSLGEGSVSYQKTMDWLDLLYPEAAKKIPLADGIEKRSPFSTENIIPAELLRNAIHELQSLPEHSEAKGNKKSVKAAFDRAKVLADFRADSYKDFPDLFKGSFRHKEFPVLPGILENEEILPSVMELIHRIQHVTEEACFLNHCREYADLMLNLANDCLSRYSQYKKEHNLIDYNDMELFFLELLQMDEVREEIRSSIRLVMVDEFQDCNVIQIGIFRELVKLVEENYWVGDSKQAIYGFRGSDSNLVANVISAMHQRLDEFADTDVRFGMLKTGYRSVPGLVQLSNELFTKLLRSQQQDLPVKKDMVRGNSENPEFTHWMKKTFGNEMQVNLSPDDLIPLIPARTETENGAGFIRMKKSGSVKIKDAIVSAIARLLQSDNPFEVEDNGILRPIRPGDIAILCRNNRQVDAYSKALAEAGFPVSYGREDFYNTAEFRLLHSLLLYARNPFDRLAELEINLLTKSLSHAEAGSFMLTAMETAPESRVIENEIFIRLAGISFQRRLMGPGDLAEILISELNLAGILTQYPDLQQRINNLRQFVKLCREFEKEARNEGGSALLEDFLIWLEIEKDQLSMAESGNRNVILVTTMHKAKGLEWPVVIPVGSSGMFEKINNLEKVYSIRTDGGISESPAHATESSKEEMHVILGFRPFGKMTDFPGRPDEVLNQSIQEKLKMGEWNEHLRLMYVAVTRARDILVDIRTEDEGADFLGIHAMLEEGNFADLSGIINEEKYPSIEIGEYQVPDVPLENLPIWTLKRPGLEKGAFQPFYIQPSKMDDGKASGNCQTKLLMEFGSRLEIKADKDRFNQWFPGREDEFLGNLLHAIFYLEDIENLSTDAFSVMAGRLFSITEENLIKLKNLYQAFFDWCHQLAGDNCCFHRELPLEMLKDGQVWTGTADLVLEGNNGVFLIDYKSYQGGLNEITNPASDKYSGRYFAQLSAYREMLSAIMEDPGLFRGMYIFYPMSGFIVQVSEK